jgi:hypothetical protein
MNERIQEFKIECLEWNEEDQVWQVNAEKFAELIVEECVNVAMRAVSDDEPKEAWYLIQEHFGVEE